MPNLLPGSCQKGGGGIVEEEGEGGGDGMAVRFCEQVIECRMQVAGRRREFSELFWDAKVFGK